MPPIHCGHHHSPSVSLNQPPSSANSITTTSGVVSVRKWSDSRPQPSHLSIHTSTFFKPIIPSSHLPWGDSCAILSGYQPDFAPQVRLQQGDLRHHPGWEFVVQICVTGTAPKVVE